MAALPSRPATPRSLAAPRSADPGPPPRPPITATLRARKLVLLAQGVDDEPAGWGCAGAVLLLAGAIAGPAWLATGPRWLGLATCAAMAAALGLLARRGRRLQGAREDRLARALGDAPFPVDGLLHWLVADRPLADLRLAAPLDPARLEQAVRAIDPGATVTWRDPTCARLALTPQTLRAAHGRRPAVRAGDLRLLQAVVERALRPLHAAVGVERLELGGELHVDPR